MSRARSQVRSSPPCYHFGAAQEADLIERTFAPGEKIGQSAQALRRGWWALTAFYLSAVADLAAGLLDHSRQSSRLTLALGVALVVASVLVAGSR